MAALVALQRTAPPALATVGRRTGRPLADLEKEFRGLVAAARGKGYTVAGDNLEHFLDGKGATRAVPLNWLRAFGVVTAAELKNRTRFHDQLNKKAKALVDGGSAILTDHWDARVDASMATELFYASGVSQLRSTGSFTLTRAGNSVAISGTVQQRWFDPYNWNPGSGAWIPGHGVVTDDVGLDLKDASIGSDYLLENHYSQTMAGTYVTGPWYLPDSSTFTWAGP